MTYDMRKKADRFKLAAAFRKVGNDFKKLCDYHRLEDTMVDMSESHDKRPNYLNLCDTPACHGGWGAILYGKTVDQAAESVDDEVDYCDVPDSFDFYQIGAGAIANELGFEDADDLAVWAGEYPRYWGNDWGEDMFCNGEAFGKKFQSFPLPVIYEHYFSVARRLEDIEL